MTINLLIIGVALLISVLSAIVIDILAWRHVFRGWDAMRLHIDAQDREITRLDRTIVAHSKSISALNRNGVGS